MFDFETFYTNIFFRNKKHIHVGFNSLSAFVILDIQFFILIFQFRRKRKLRVRRLDARQIEETSEENEESAMVSQGKYQFVTLSIYTSFKRCHQYHGHFILHYFLLYFI